MIVCVVQITVTKNKLYCRQGYLLVQNVDCRLQNALSADRIQNVDCRLQSGYKMQTENEKFFFRLVCENMSSFNLLSVMQSLFRDQLSQVCALLWNIPGPFLDQNRS